MITTNALVYKENMLQVAEDDYSWLGLKDIPEETYNWFHDHEYDIGKDPADELVSFLTSDSYLHAAAQYILNVNPLPFQIVILDTLWNKRLPLLVGSRGLGKTWIMAVYALLRAVLTPGARVVIVGAGFRQAKHVFDYMTNIWENAPVLQEITGTGKASGPKRDTDRCYMKVGNSMISALPLGSGDKIRGERACVGPKTIVETNVGLVRIKDSEDLLGKMSVLTGIEDKTESPSCFLQTKPIDAYKIRTTGGYEFICSEIHQVYTKDGWKIGKDLTLQDYLIFENNYKFPKDIITHNGLTIDEKMAWVLGVLLSCGRTDSKNKISFKVYDKKMSGRIISLLKEIRPDISALSIEIPEHIDMLGRNRKKAYEIQLNNQKFRSELLSVGLDVTTAKEREIPWSILRSPRSVVVSFLRGLFETGGNAILYKDKFRDNNLGITFYCSSEQLSSDIQILLSKLDIFAGRNSRVANGGTKIKHAIRVYGDNALSLASLLNIDNWVDTYNKSEKHGNRAKKKSLLRVTSVKKLVGKYVLYDYTMPESHSFMGNGFRQHNSHILIDEYACLDKNTVIETELGLIRIADCRDLPGVSLFTGNDQKPMEVADKFIITPPTDVFEVKTKYGYTFRCSNIHTVKTGDGFKLAKDLAAGDSLIFENKYKFPTDYIVKDGLTVDEDLAWLMGVLVAEGAVCSKHSISLVNTDKIMTDRVFSMLERYSKNKVYYIEKESYVYDRGWKCKKSYTVGVCDMVLRDKLESLGLCRKRAKGKIIPWSILRSPRSVVVKFLSGLFEGDGSCFLYKDKKNTKVGVSYYSVSRQLMEEVQIVLAKLDIISSICSRKSNIGNNKQWVLRINGIYAKMLIELLDIRDWKEVLSKAFVFERGKPATRLLPVKSVKKLERQERLYDFYLPVTNSFYGNCFIQHNSVPKEIIDVVVQGFAVVSQDPVAKVREAAQIDKLKEVGAWSEEIKKAYYAGRGGNQIIRSGTAYYAFNHFADDFKKWKAVIESCGDPQIMKDLFGSDPLLDAFNWRDYAILRIPYTSLPRGFLDEGIVQQAKITLHTGQFNMEYGACFITDTNGFYRRSLIESCTCNKPIKTSDGFEVQFSAKMYGEENHKCVLGVDAAAINDNMAMVVLEQHETNNRVVYCWATRKKDFDERKKAGMLSEHNYYDFCANQIIDICRKFPIERIEIDSAGGGLAIVEALADPAKYKGNELPIYELIDDKTEKWTDSMDGRHIVNQVKVTNNYNSEANHGMKKDMENKSLLFPKFDTVELAKANIMDDQLELRFDTYEDNVMNIEELKNEISTIVISQTSKLGAEHFDTPDIKGEGQKKGRLRKDRFSALLYANYFVRNKNKQDSINVAPPVFGGRIEHKNGSLINSSKEVKNPYIGAGAGFIKQGKKTPNFGVIVKHKSV